MNIVVLLTKLLEPAFTRAGVGDYPVVLQPAKNPKFGDYQVNGVMLAAKETKQNPKSLAEAIIKGVQENDIIQSLEIAGPGFINLRLKSSFLNQQVNLALQDERLEVNPSLKGKKVIIDYSSPNLAKQMHVGHLRSTIIGDSLNRLYRFLGAEVIAQNHVGDWGTQFGMLVAYLIEQEQNNDGEFVLSDLELFYQQAKQKFDEVECFAARAREYVVRLQNNDPEVLQYWRKFVAVSTQHIQSLYARLGVLLTESNLLGESAYNSDLPYIVDSLLEKGIAVDDKGTKLIYLDDVVDENGNPGVFIVQKQDGGYLYATTDFACLKRNVEEHHADSLIYVVDSRQALHFKSLFDISKRAGWLPDMVHAEHVAFGTMMGRDGKPFKTRTGGTVKLVDLLDEAVHRASELVKEKNPHLTDTEIANIAKVVGIGAVKYADLSKNRLSDYVFNWDKMLSFEGNTAPYLQYAYARINSLLTKAEVDLPELICSFDYREDVEKQLAVLLLQFEVVLFQALDSHHPHYVTTYLYQVATLFSRFYESCDILQAEPALKLARLGLSWFTGRTLRQGLELLGIDVLDRM